MGIPEIHHLVQQFINDDKVVPNGFLLEFFEVFREDLVGEAQGALAWGEGMGRRLHLASGSKNQLTEVSLCRKVKSSAAFEFFLVRATTVVNECDGRKHASATQHPTHLPIATRPSFQDGVNPTHGKGCCA